MDEAYLQHLSELNVSDLRRLMEMYGEDVWNYAYVITRNTHTADDVAQEVFIKAYRSFAGFRGEASVKTWLLKIARNTALSYRMKPFLRKVMLFGDRMPDGDSEVSTTAQRAPSAESEYIEKEKMDDIWRQVLRLPTKFRDPLVLSVHYGLSVEEIGRVTGATLGTVKSRIHRARKKIADAWEGENADE